VDEEHSPVERRPVVAALAPGSGPLGEGRHQRLSGGLVEPADQRVDLRGAEGRRHQQPVGDVRGLLQPFAPGGPYRRRRVEHPDQRAFPG
jgi:hypothetical protein